MATHSAELFKGLSPEETQRITDLGQRVRVGTGKDLFRLGEPADSIFIVERGRIALTLPMQVGGRDEDVSIEERTPGEAFGWSALIPPHRFTLKATAPLETEVLAIPRGALFEHFAAHPEVGYIVTRNVAEVMGQRLQILQAMWLREMQRGIGLRTVSTGAGT